MNDLIAWNDSAGFSPCVHSAMTQGSKESTRAAKEAGREARCAAMARSSLFLLLSLSPLVASSAAWLSRRALLCSSAGALLAPPALAVPARTGPNSVFNGEYDDPKHPGCLRSIKVGGAPLLPDGRRSRKPQALVAGVDKACEGPPDINSVWKLVGSVSEDGETIFIDFSPKGGPKDLLGVWDGDGIKFPDGNKWTKVPNGTPGRRPKPVTLTSETELYKPAEK